MTQKAKDLISKHKIIASFGVAVLAAGGYFGYAALKSDDSTTSYVLAAVEKGNLIISVSGSGQVSAFSQIEIKPQASGNIISINAQSGQEVKAGTLLAQIDSREAQKTVRDAAASLESAKLSLEKLRQPADALSLLQAENSLAQAKDNLVKLKLTQEMEYQKALQSEQSAEDDLSRDYENGFNNFSNVFLDLPGIMDGLSDVLFDYTISQNQQNIDYYSDAIRRYDFSADVYKNSAYQNYQFAKAKYDQNFVDYKKINRASDKAEIEAMIEQAHETTKAVSEAIKSATDLLQFYQDKLKERSMNPISASSTHISSLNNYTSKINTHLSNLSSSKLSIQNDKVGIQNAEKEISDMIKNHPLEISAQEQAIMEKEGSLAKLKAGTDALDIQSQEIAVKQRQNALQDAKEKLADYSIRAPLDGILAEINVKKGDSVSSGSSAATIITKQQLADISLNEVDAAKIKVGQKAMLNFDAVEGLEIAGSVVEIDILGAVSQGVVSYNAKISFDTQDERIKSGMSVSASIIIQTKQNALLAPNSAIKSANNVNYVEIFDNNIAAAGAMTIVSSALPKQQEVQIGLSNDSMTEIISGLGEGDKVVSRTINSQTTTVSQTQGLFSMPGGARSSSGAR